MDRHPETGKQKVTFDGKGYKDLPVTVPCGWCLGCREDKAKMWGARCYHESKLHEKNCFVTLTYEEEKLPEGGTLVKDHVSGFMKNLRKRKGQGVRFFACGEYGEKTKRPHYHIILFNCSFDDKVLWKKTRSKQNLYISQELKEIWKNGICTVQDLTIGTAMYCAQYSLKKVIGAKAESHYAGRIPEFALMSRNPGIASRWIDKNRSDVFPKDCFHINGRPYKPPRYYDEWLKKHDPMMYEDIKDLRMRKAKEEDVGGVRRFRIEEAKAAILKTLRKKRSET